MLQYTYIQPEMSFFMSVQIPRIVIVIVVSGRNRKNDSEVQYNIIERLGTIEHITIYL